MTRIDKLQPIVSSKYIAFEGARVLKDKAREFYYTALEYTIFFGGADIGIAAIKKFLAESSPPDLLAPIGILAMAGLVVASAASSTIASYRTKGQAKQLEGASKSDLVSPEDLALIPKSRYSTVSRKALEHYLNEPERNRANINTFLDTFALSPAERESVNKFMDSHPGTKVNVAQIADFDQRGNYDQKTLPKQFIGQDATVIDTSVRAVDERGGVITSFATEEQAFYRIDNYIPNPHPDDKYHLGPNTKIARLEFSKVIATDGVNLGTDQNYTDRRSLSGVRDANCVITISVQKEIRTNQNLNPTLTVMLNPNASRAISGLMGK